MQHLVPNSLSTGESQKKIVDAFKKGNTTTALALISRLSNEQLLAIKDEEGNSLWHLAVKDKKHHETLRKLYEQLTKKPSSQDMIKLKNKKGQTLWHVAAECGNLDFFTQGLAYLDIEGSEEQDWIDLEDNEKNTPLHLAVKIKKNTPISIIKNKKKIVAKLIEKPGVNLNHPNKAGDTPLFLAVKEVNYPSVKQLLQSSRTIEVENDQIKIVNKNNLFATGQNSRPIGSIAKDKKSSRIENILKLYSSEVTIDINTEKDKNNIFDSEVVKKEAANPDSDIQGIVDQFRPFVKEYNQAQIEALAKTHYQAIRKKNNFRNSLNSFFGAGCTAFTIAAAMVGFGGILEPILIGVVFLVTFIPLIYASYAAKLKEDKLKAEELYRSCANIKIQDLNNEILLEELKEKKLIVSNTSSVKDINKTKTELQSFYETNKKTNKQKLKNCFIKHEELRERKNQVIRDPANISKWATWKQKLGLFVAYKTDIFCATGFIMDIVGVIGSLFLSEAVIGSLGIGSLISLFGGPVGVAVLTIAITLVIGIIVGTALYHSSYVSNKEEAGAKNKDLVLVADSLNYHSYKHMNTTKLLKELQSKKSEELQKNSENRELLSGKRMSTEKLKKEPQNQQQSVETEKTEALEKFELLSVNKSGTENYKTSTNSFYGMDTSSRSKSDTWTSLISETSSEGLQRMQACLPSERKKREFNLNGDGNNKSLKKNL